MKNFDHRPEILAPAGDMEAALAAFAAGADAVYLGLKNFSARAQSENFSLTDLSRLADLAGAENRKIYVALNSVLKSDDLAPAGRLVARLARDVKPNALIVQDIGALDLARQAGFEGELHLSTLANVTHPAALFEAARLGASRVILPRELSIDEIRQTCAAAPPGLALELFVHGALCYCVSGRCYWSSYLGGKSGLRGRCVQPCRRVYAHKQRAGAFFSCLDLSLDLMAKTLLDIPNLASWKIEGRRKGPHYVFYVTTAYRMLRDNPADPQIKKAVEDILDMALGRPHTRGRFLPQHEAQVTSPDGQSASGLFVSKVTLEALEQAGKGKAARKGEAPRAGKEARPGPVLLKISPRLELLPGDYLRIGLEDEDAHFTTTVTKHIPKGGALTLRPSMGKPPKSGTPVYLLDRREPELRAALKTWEGKLGAHAGRQSRPINWEPDLAAPVVSGAGPGVDKTATGKAKTKSGQVIILRSSIPHGKDTRTGRHSQTLNGLWLSRRTAEETSRTVVPRVSWWLPPVIWPDEEQTWRQLLARVMANNAAHFVCNAPWQMALLRDAAGEDLSRLTVTAGPFCNITNPLAVRVLAEAGFNQAVVSPELSGEDLLALPALSPLPLGIVLSGFWPVGLSRHKQNPKLLGEPLASPKRETFWLRQYGQNLWVYPAWPLDISDKKDSLVQAGYALFIHIHEHPGRDVPDAGRVSPFNWELGLL